ncbi:MAG: hypothetical protein AMS22_06135 [Thiotrichales bacterium SG8_50]|nr:MAG: hypothetical protein AMS22_06135 [Thiotrichales bacterium SG8_50]
MKYIPCQKRRRVIRKEQSGERRELYRCAHGGAETYGKEVEEESCSRCTLRQVLLSHQPCKLQAPANAIYPQPMYGEDGEVRYTPTDAAPPICPRGYARREDDAWTFDSAWYPCPFRAFNNDRKPDGQLQVNAYCSIVKKAVLPKECEHCKGALTQVGASTNPEDIPDFPAVKKLAVSYWQAVKNWIKAGRPIRTDTEVNHLHATYCSQCNWYDKKSQRCKGCGCKVRAEGAALMNKIRMETEHCPRDFW